VDVLLPAQSGTQLSEVFKRRVSEPRARGFHVLESAVEAGEIQYYGMATWNGFRQAASARDALQLGEIAQIAQELRRQDTSASCNAVQPWR